MELIETAVRKAGEKSPSIRKLIELQDAYIHASRRLHTSEEYADTLVYQACRYALQCYSAWMAEKLQAGIELRRSLQDENSFPWHEAVYVFFDKVPAVSELVEKEIEE